ncbi:Quinolinate synthase A [Candidatus Entotheonellaceae bacterium PAL068K]
MSSIDVSTPRARKTPLPEWDLALRDALAPHYARVQKVIPEAEWAVYAPYIYAIQELKVQRNAVILAHNYQTPEIFHGIADLSGDSLALAQQAASTDADVIVLCGVHFMAETAKLLNPDKTVLIPDLEAGCSLASSITTTDVRALRARYPGVPVVTYINTSAAVKAESDLCCTSANALQAVQSLGVDRVIFLPDEYLAKYVALQTDVEIIAWQGHCEVHERFTGDELRQYREDSPDIYILAHPECPPDVLEEADFVGSTAGMIRHLDQTHLSHVVMLTECSMSDNVAVQFPDINFIRPCNLCPHMKRISLEKILLALDHLQYEVKVDADIAQRARHAVERMVTLGRGEGQ